ncbi:hypothetical protein GQX73_g5348 [Xylaria multiplex]|uniref:Uncharacterized protein n=1 Tax=Xylaria multiplex TaxID=323545 RepID=A0A7C8INI4_9PEZI|nr:hypothetical protein GQX73_g5348 [Xylaria multiplex]
MLFSDSADTFIPALNAPQPTLETNSGSIPDTTFQINNDLSSLLASMPGSSSLQADSWPLQFTGLPNIPQEKSLTRKDYTKMTLICDNYAPWQLADPSTKAALTMDTLKKFHITFAHNSCTLYIHRYLYKENMPRWMLQAYTTCLTYTNQTAVNRAVVLRVLHDNVADLKATANNTTLVPQEKLARVHALMFYQTIRMFDGDITLGQQADDDMALLESWNKDLCKVRDNLDDLSNKENSVRDHPPESWELIWMIGVLPIAGRSLGHLWDAQNSFDFFRAWKERPLFIMSTFDFEDFLKTGTGDDLDEFAFYFLALINITIGNGYAAGQLCFICLLINPDFTGGHDTTVFIEHPTESFAAVSYELNTE